MRKALITVVVSVLVACAGEDDGSSANMVTEALITDFRTEECYCCPSVTIETDDETYIVDEFPSMPLQQSELPVSVLVQLKSYTGDCPNRNVSVSYLNE